MARPAVRLAAAPVAVLPVVRRLVVLSEAPRAVLRLERALLLVRRVALVPSVLRLVLLRQLAVLLPRAVVVRTARSTGSSRYKKGGLGRPFYCHSFYCHYSRA